MQTTFGKTFGLKPLLPTAPHPNDGLICEDTGEYKRRMDCLFSYDGKAWTDEEELDDYEGMALVVLAEKLKEECEDCIDSSIDDVRDHAFNTVTWREYVADYYRDNCDYCGDCDDLTDQEFGMVCDKLMECAESCVKTSGYSDFDYDLLCWDVEEYHYELDINDHPLLVSLHGRDKLEGILDYPFVPDVHNGRLEMMIVSGKTYWWGCSHETMKKVYHDIVG